MSTISTLPRWKAFLYILRSTQFCASVKFLLDQTDQECQIRSRRLKLSEFDFTMHHLSGILNTAADALTRGTSTVTVDKSFQLIQLCPPFNMVILALTVCLQLLKNTKDAHNISNAEEICRKVTTNCRVSAQIKPQWVKPPNRACHQIN